MDEKRVLIVKIFLIVIFLLIIGRLFFLMIIKNDYYNKLLEIKTVKYIEGSSAKRGRIIDIKGKILVDNIGVKVIVYNKLSGVKMSDELDVVKSLANILDMKEEPTLLELKTYWLVLNSNNNLIKEEEQRLLQERKLSKEDIKELKLSRITKEMLSNINKDEALIYSLMNKGYSYDDKIIKRNVTEEEYAKVIESNLKGIRGDIDWERYYPYGNTLKGLLGSVSNSKTGIPKELKNYYLDLGYSLNDRVGISYLEMQYESFLKGKKAVYKINNDKTLTKVSDEEKGNDLVLNIDIEYQIAIENILKEEMVKAKNSSNTEYYNHSFIILSDVKTGGIVSLVGLQILDNKKDYSFVDIGTNAIVSSYVMGSVIKGASMTFGYQNNLIDIGTKMNDSCVKLYFIPEKCSHKRLGVIDDIKALKYSSNYYQFIIAVKSTDNKYKFNMELNSTLDDFNAYRNTFNEFGLGVLTGIDLPNEKLGVKGKTVADDLLLNFAIGQYDSYTPIELSQYINTIANNGNRIKPSLMHSIIDSKGNIIKEMDNKILNKVNLEEKYLNRIQIGFKEVMEYGGTGSGYTNLNYKPAGKTGTSQNFVDSNNDGKVDVETLNITYAMYYPYDNPKYSMIIVTPNITHKEGLSDYRYPMNRKLGQEISKKLFTIQK